MKQKQMMAVAIACGLVCALCVGLFMVSVRNEADAARNEALARFGGEQVEAYVATRDIVAGERVDLSAVETKLWVADLLPEGAVRSSSDAVGKTATSSIYKGEVITSGRFEVGADALEVPAGKQAVSVPAKAVQAVGGAIRPGMSVDIYSSGGSSTDLLASGVNVLDTSVGSSGSLSTSGDGWVTLAIEPSRVQEVIAASGKTTLYFTLPGESFKGDEKSEAGNQADKDKKPPKEQSASSSKEAEKSASGSASGADESASSSSAVEDEEESFEGESSSQAESEQDEEQDE